MLWIFSKVFFFLLYFIFYGFPVYTAKSRFSFSLICTCLLQNLNWFIYFQLVNEKQLKSNNHACRRLSSKYLFCADGVSIHSDRWGSRNQANMPFPKDYVTPWQVKQKRDQEKLGMSMSIRPLFFLYCRDWVSAESFWIYERAFGSRFSQLVCFFVTFYPAVPRNPKKDVSS